MEYLHYTLDSMLLLYYSACTVHMWDILIIEAIMCVTCMTIASPISQINIPCKAYL